MEYAVMVIMMLCVVNGYGYRMLVVQREHRKQKQSKVLCCVKASKPRSKKVGAFVS